jgi:hypothetical protein
MAWKRKHIFRSGSQLEPYEKCKGQFWKSSGHAQGPDWTLLFFHGPGKQRLFSPQAPNLDFNRNARAYLEKFGTGSGA